MNNNEDRIEELEAQVAQLTSLVERLAENGEARSAEIPMPLATSSRRNMLKLAGAAAVGVAAAAVSGVGQAAADNGITTTNANVATTLNYTGTVATAAFLFQSGTSYAPGISFFPAALSGWAGTSGTDNVPNGIYGYTDKNGIGVMGWGAGASATGVVARGTGSNFRLFAEGTAAPLRATAHVLGDIINDSTGNIWVNVAAGTPGQWLRLAGPTTSGSLNLLASPKRVYDSRVGALPAIAPKTPLTNLSSRTIDCTGNASGVPAGARGVLLNVTVVTLTANGFLAVTPGGAGFTGTSTLNWTGVGAVIANSVTTATGANATIDVTAGGGGSTDVIVDVFGYYL